MTLRARIALLVAVACALVVAAVSVAAYATVSRQLSQQLDDALVTRAESAVGSPLSDPTRLVQVPAEALGAGDVRIGLVRADGQQFFARGGSPAPFGQSEIAVARGESDSSLRTDGRGESSQRVVAVPAGQGFALVLAQSLEPLDRTLDRLKLVLAVVGGIGVVVAGLVGLAVARASLRPVERLTSAAERVALTGDLAPIEVSGTDELGRLAARFNEMLAALTESRERQRQLVADAGHELRTPLTSLRTNLDLLAQSDDAAAAGRATLPANERADLLDDVRAQVAELAVLVGDVVELARDDTPAATVAETLDLAEVVERSVERVRRRAPTVQFDVQLASWWVVGDPAALERAATNLLDNAAKWSPPNGTITVRLVNGQLYVADQGPGIAAEDLPHVFERFYRSADARSTSGSGLGLAIVQQVAQRHGGAVAAGPAPGGGTLLTLRLPGRAFA